ncbi:MAG: ABC transporter permease [Thermoleophilia bacterium]|nr:ABC transporter permease [Thermoleophilia bacterium]
MGAWLIRRLLRCALTIFAVSLITFAIFFMMPGTGDPAVRMAGKNPTDEQITQIRKQYGMDKSKPVFYATLMKQIVTGAIESKSTGTKVVPAALRGIPVTFSLALVASFIWLAFGITFGIQGALHPGSLRDRMLMIVALIGISVPMAWLSLYSLATFTSIIPIFPPGDYQTVSYGGIFGWMGHLILPGATLAVVFSGVYARMTRSNVRQALREEYVKTAVAKGLPGRQVFTRHVLRTGLIPIIVLFGLDFGALMGGAIFTESIFGIPGLGSFLMDGIKTFDFTVLIVGSLVAATFVVLANMVVDVVQAIVDPRIRLA